MMVLCPRGWSADGPELLDDAPRHRALSPPRSSTLARKAPCASLCFLWRLLGSVPLRDEDLPQETRKNTKRERRQEATVISSSARACTWRQIGDQLARSPTMLRHPTSAASKSMPRNIISSRRTVEITGATEFGSLTTETRRPLLPCISWFWLSAAGTESAISDR